MSIVDLFKEYGERDKPTPNVDIWFNRSIRNSYGIHTSNVHRKEEESPLEKLMNNISECKAINNRNEGVPISITASNRIQKIEINNQISLKYADCKKIEENNDSKYNNFVRDGFKIWNCYKYDHFLRGEVVHMVLATK